MYTAFQSVGISATAFLGLCGECMLYIPRVMHAPLAGVHLQARLFRPFRACYLPKVTPLPPYSTY